MEEISFEQLLLALVEPTYKEHRVTFLQILCNKVIDDPNEIKKEDVNDAFDTILSLLVSKSTKSSDIEVINYILSFLNNLTFSEDNSELFLSFLVDKEEDKKYATIFGTIIERFVSHNPQLEPDDHTDEDWTDIGKEILSP